MSNAVALIAVGLPKTFLGLPSRAGEMLGGATVLQHTLMRIARIEQLERLVVVHQADADPQSLIDRDAVSKPVSFCSYDAQGTASHRLQHAAARKWALGSWRGGLGGATCYDELLPADPLAQAMQEAGTESALLVGGDWAMVDPDICAQVLARHLEHPDEMRLVFSQAPPGLAGIAVHRELLINLTETHATFGKVLGYNPTKPQADPIGHDVCIHVPPAVRGCATRFIIDTPRSATMAHAIADELGEAFANADAAKVVEAATRISSTGSIDPPRQVTLELTPRRGINGPLIPQHYMEFHRPDMEPATAKEVVRQLGEVGDVVLTLGGLGDALLHPQWEEIVHAAHDAGVLGIAIETDLLCDSHTIDCLLDTPVDIVTVRVNADRAETYARVMTNGHTPPGEGEAMFKRVVGNLERFINERNRRTREIGGPAGYPWLVPRLAKTAETLGDLETFFDRWTHYAGQAVIEPAPTGCGLMPDLNIIQMAPPRRCPCRQLGERMSILSDGAVALCDQDWRGKAALGDAKTAPLLEIWREVAGCRRAHVEQRWEELALCGDCDQWHRP